MQPISPDQLLRITEVSRLTSLAKSTINLWVAQGKFPKPITLSPTIKVWRNQSLLDWIDTQAEVSSFSENFNKETQEITNKEFLKEINHKLNIILES
jgi:prophage regulatory protein